VSELLEGVYAARQHDKKCELVGKSKSNCRQNLSIRANLCYNILSSYDYQASE
jgi:hypothetical protein